MTSHAAAIFRYRTDDPTWFTCPANTGLLARYCVDVLDFDRYDLLRLVESPWDWRDVFKAAVVWQSEQGKATKVKA